MLTRTASAFSPTNIPPSNKREFCTNLWASSLTLGFGPSVDGPENYNSTVIIGKPDSMKEILPTLLEPIGLQNLDSPIYNAMIDDINSKKGGESTTMIKLEDDSAAHKVILGSLPATVSRNNHPMSVHSITKLVGSAKGNSRILILSDDFPIGPLASSVAKAFPLFSKKSNVGTERKIDVAFCKSDGTFVDDSDQLKAAQSVATGVQLAARLVDSHPELMTTTRFAEEVESLASEYPNVSFKQLVGEELEAYGGLYAVGKAAVCPPRLVLLEYDGGGDETVALVGKGIVYDTGGLSLKPKTGMCGMKHDMGGSAGLLGGFFSAVELGVKKKVHCILCLAENAIGPTAFRNDDILSMYSGKSVEVNNCDAEGRLVLGDGVAHATKHIENLDLVVDMATLTGAQLVATGKKHAGILSNKEAVEKRAVSCGMHSGDLCFPLLYAPELLMDEFKSEVADMKNSVKDRSNAQTSCAGHFIESHLDESYEGGWLHVDMAGPGSNGERGTGYGVGLVLSLLEAPGF